MLNFVGQNSHFNLFEYEILHGANLFFPQISNDQQDLIPNSLDDKNESLKAKEAQSFPVVHNSLPVVTTNQADKKEGAPVSREKLKYLRYFRLETHRKRNGKLISDT